MTTDITSATAAAKPTRTRRGKTPAAASIPTAAPASTTPSKSDTVIKLLLRAKGATPLELIAATDWQPHSVRAFLSGLRKKGRVILREARKSGEFAYRIVVAPAPVVAQPPEGPQGSIVHDASSNDTVQA